MVSIFCTEFNMHNMRIYHFIACLKTVHILVKYPYNSSFPLLINRHFVIQKSSYLEVEVQRFFQVVAFWEALKHVNVCMIKYGSDTIS